MASLGDFLKTLNNPAPAELDPEDDYEYEAKSLLTGKNAERDHYVNVGPSKLKNSQLVELSDKKYQGKKSSRKELYGDSSSEEEEEEDDDSEINSDDIGDEENEESEENENEVEVENEDEDLEDSEEEEKEEDEEEEEEEEEENEENNDLNDELKDEFAQLEKEQNEMVNNMSQSIKSDIEKGKQVKNQISICDSLLDLRIRIQKAVNVANQFPQYDVFSYFSNENEEAEKKVNETKKETLNLINELLEIRKDLTESNKELKKINNNNSKKRKREIDDEDLIEGLWEDINDYNSNFVQYQNDVLEKWNKKVQTTAGIQKQFKAVNQSIVSQIEQLLSDKDRLIKRTQLKRSDYTSLGKQESEKKENEEEHVDEHLANYDPEIFDDTDFYQQLLKELIESRMSETDDPIALSMKWATFKALQQKNKKKKKVDTKASKGRKIRYHVHEKIQNFMVPIEMGTWHEEMTNELFKSLFGRNINKPEEKEEEEEPIDLVNADDGKLTTNDGLRIFG